MKVKDLQKLLNKASPDELDLNISCFIYVNDNQAYVTDSIRFDSDSARLIVAVGGDKYEQNKKNAAMEMYFRKLA